MEFAFFSFPLVKGNANVDTFTAMYLIASQWRTATSTTTTPKVIEMLPLFTLRHFQQFSRVFFFSAQLGQRVDWELSVPAANEVTSCPASWGAESSWSEFLVGLVQLKLANNCFHMFAYILQRAWLSFSLWFPCNLFIAQIRGKRCASFQLERTKKCKSKYGELFVFFWQIKKVADVHRKGILSASVAH